MLYIVGTPIGNLKDISERALDMLRKADVILAENPMDSLKLLSAYSIKKEVIKYNDKNKKTATRKILEILKDKDVAYITSAGMPGISDPGQDLVRLARKEGIGISVVPGPSALTAAIALSGVRSREFTFVSFPPKKSGALKRLFEKYRGEKGVLIFFESPYRLLKTLKILNEAAPESFVFVAKELTKLFERSFEGTPSEVLMALGEDPKHLKGEFTVLADFQKRAG